jgi:hypothetical protein
MHTAGGYDNFCRINTCKLKLEFEQPDEPSSWLSGPRDLGFLFQNCIYKLAACVFSSALASCSGFPVESYLERPQMQGSDQISLYSQSQQVFQIFEG